MMRKVLDTNYLQCEELRAYLSTSVQHHVVLTDYAAMEAYKGNTLASIYPSMTILCEYPRQVIVLKATGIVCGLSGRRAGLQRRLIEQRQTREFGTYCKNLTSARHGNVSLQRQLLHHGHTATAQMEALLAHAVTLSDVFDELASETYSNTELHSIRKGLPYNEDMLKKLMKNTTLLAAALFRDNPYVTKRPPFAELLNTFIFRSALCGNLLALRWISVGGAKNIRSERMRNDLVDIFVAAYATYFDGLLTADRKLSKIYEDAVVLLGALLSAYPT